jgi:8-oxo-dGTP diphosphatase
MSVLDGGLAPDHEIDEARWVPEEEAGSLLTYDHDRELLDRFAARAAAVSLVRHAKAGSRQSWHGPDRLRPLSDAGRTQAERLASSFEGRPLGRLLSSPYLRCVETLAPLAARRGLAIERTEALAEGAPIEAALRLITEVGRDGGAALCTHGDIMTGVVRRLLEDGVRFSGTASVDFKSDFRKGSTWDLEVRAGAVTSAGPLRDER